jgi:nucleoside-diphosphate-sugar epimerase
MMPRFTILGASGFLGGCLASQLVVAEHQVFQPSRTELQSLQDQDLGHIFYCLGTDDARKNPYGAYQSHIAYLAEVLRFSTFTSLTYISSTRIYLGAQSAREDSELKILPNDDNAIFNTMKLAAEQLCFAEGNPAVRVVRLSNVIGFSPNGISLVPALIKDALKKQQMRLMISAQSSKDYIAIDDALELLPRIAVEGKLRCYNVASGVNWTLGEIVRIIENEIPSSCEWRHNAPTVAFPIIDISRIRSEFSYNPRPATEALVSACTQFRQNFM